MFCHIKLKTGEEVAIENLTVIRQHEMQYIKESEITDFNSFQLRSTQYTFIGDKSLLISGQDILFVTFEK